MKNETIDKVKKISSKNIDRLIIYRKILNKLRKEGIASVYSHKLAFLSGNTPAQVRRDLMDIGYHGTPVHGYKVNELYDSISSYLDSPTGTHVAILGLGHLGHAVLDYCYNRRDKIRIEAAFDIDPFKVGRVFNGCRCYHIDDIEQIVRSRSIKVAILAIPTKDAQKIVDRLVRSGVKGILNYTSLQLSVESDVYVENNDMMLSLEKTIFFSTVSDNKN